MKVFQLKYWIQIWLTLKGKKKKYRRDDLHTLKLRHFFLDIKAEFKSMAKKYGQNEQNNSS